MNYATTIDSSAPLALRMPRLHACVRFDHFTTAALKMPADPSCWRVIATAADLQHLVPELLPNTDVRVWPAEEGPDSGEVRLVWISSSLGRTTGPVIGCQLIDQDENLLHTIMFDSPFVVVTVRITATTGTVIKPGPMESYPVSVECRQADVENPRTMFAWLCQMFQLDRSMHFLAIERHPST